MGFNVGGINMGRSASRSQSSSSTDQEVFLASLFEQLGVNARDLTNAFSTGPITNTANRLFDSGTSFLADLEGGPGAQALRDSLNPDSSAALVDDQIAGLTSDLEKFFSESLLPGISDQSIASGGLGGTRQGVAQGIAAEGVTRELGRGVTDIRLADQARRDRAAETLSGRELEATQTGLAALPELFDIFSAGQMAPFQPFLNLAEILGDPTVLTEQRSSSSSRQSQFTFGIG